MINYYTQAILVMVIISCTFVSITNSITRQCVHLSAGIHQWGTLYWIIYNFTFVHCSVKATCPGFKLSHDVRDWVNDMLLSVSWSFSFCHIIVVVVVLRYLGGYCIEVIILVSWQHYIVVIKTSFSKTYVWLVSTATPSVVQTGNWKKCMFWLTSWHYLNRTLEVSTMIFQVDVWWQCNFWDMSNFHTVQVSIIQDASSNKT